MMKHQQEGRSIDQLSWGGLESARRAKQERASREIMRKLSERVEKKIDEIFAEDDTQNSK